MRLRVVDLETTGGDRTSEIIEVGIVDVVQGADGEWTPLPPVSKLFRPRGEISFHAMAVHHLTPEHFCDADPHCDEYALREMFAACGPADVMVAHSARFERGFIADTAHAGLPWICTLRSAKQVWPDAPGHSNQVLRYWRGHRHDPALADPAHRAGPDAWVTAHTLIDLLKTASIEQMIEWSNAPRDVETVPFGKHRRKPWAQVPDDYLRWMAGQSDMDADVLTAARAEIERRSRG
ncbi:exonuclease domain-containing protein [Brevundimonas sp.]|uniref:exonuclease domain-containing protein n=1 Tax=Brevundimonas sp. TaxID=1871086 RepID=UPI001A30A802|nr:exonuclease domain-containing protein [Brevundimonas sp.]MBJ7485412.1 DNA polymerase III subunit epsilon [Brevundimonas sp.]